MFSPRIATGLRDRGLDAYGIAERTELRSLPDPEVLELAMAEQRILVTLNSRDFQLLDRQWVSAGRQHGGIVFVTHRRFPRDGGAVGHLVSELHTLLTRPRPDAPAPRGICFL